MTTTDQPQTPERYMDSIARTALAIRDDLRDINPYQLLDQLTLGCQEDPHRMAQVIMTLAAMLPTDETVGVITRRVWAITTRYQT